MRFISINIALGAVLPVAMALLRKRVINDPVGEYVDRMCSPLLSNITRAIHLNISISEIIPTLVNSPFPCEQEEYIQSICIANGTTEIDFLAEQQCLCNGAFFDAVIGCNACYVAHGLQVTAPADLSLNIASLSAAECQPSPPFQPFSNLIPPINFTSISEQPPRTLGNDQFPSNTAVSNYFTPTRSITAGKITGSAVERLTSWTNTDGIRYTPTSIPANSGITDPPSRVTSIGSSTSATSSSSTAAGIATARGAQAAGGLLAAVLAVAVLL